ncbi:hypothetical protein GJ496_012010 [Pomphorhynchus laevis]|nr:hypothetical protein GJ496_012010 [Pomphorhynchus laevis]
MQNRINFRSPLLSRDEIITSMSDFRNELISAFSGLLFAIGWWIIIDAACMYPDNDDFKKAYHAIGVVSTIALIMINIVSSSRINNDMYMDNPQHTILARFWMFTGFLLSFGSLIASLWILISVYLIPHKSPTSPGISLFFQNICIFTSSLILRFARVDSS